MLLLWPQQAVVGQWSCPGILAFRRRYVDVLRRLAFALNRLLSREKYIHMP